MPNERKAINSKWVYKVVRDTTRAIERHKAKLVVKGYSQAAKIKLGIHAMDVVSAFLHGELVESIYMKQAKGFNDNVMNLYI